MVELELADYSEIMDWFVLAFGKKKKGIENIHLHRMNIIIS